MALGSLSNSTRMNRRGGRWRLGIGIALLASCATNPVTGKRELALVSEAQEIEMGQQSAQEVRQSMGVVNDPGLQAYVKKIGLQIASKSERPNLPWSFDVIDDAAVNAFALPGGFIFVTRGILGHMDNEAELASVIGHEIGHVTARHSVRQISRAQLAQLGLGIGSVLSSSVASVAGVASQGLGLLFLKFGRDDETQADDLGFKYALNEGWDVRQMKNMFEMLERVSAVGGAGRLPQYLSTHPDPENRIAKTDERLKTVTKDLSGSIINRDPFMKQIDGLVFGDNPRQGYFEGNRFNHPDLAFRIDFPQGWKTQNSPQSVAGVSASQDAIVALSLAGKDDPGTALGKFLQQQGVQGSNPSTGSINGFSAAGSDFSAATQDGKQLAGRVAFLSYGGNTYQLLGYTLAASYGNYRGAFQQWFQSFNRLTDQAALNKQPMTIHLVRLSRDMTVADFYRQYPSVVPVETIALINGADSPSSMLKGGTEVKRVQ